MSLMRPLTLLGVGLLGTYCECDMIRCHYGMIALSAGVCVGGGRWGDTSITVRDGSEGFFLVVPAVGHVGFRVEFFQPVYLLVFQWLDLHGDDLHGETARERGVKENEFSDHQVVFLALSYTASCWLQDIPSGLKRFFFSPLTNSSS